jgi:hypothetical protein
VDRRLFITASVFVLAMFCSKAPETSTTATTSTSTTTSAQVTATTPAPPPPTTQTVPTTSTTAAAAPATASLQSQETNWPGVTAEVTEFRRKGNSLTAKVRLTNKGSKVADPEILWRDVALIDAAGGKKYEVLKDEQGAFISSNRAGWTDRWSARIEPATSQVIWMKFPAPPPDVKTITLQIPQMPPFDDLQIQD